MKVLRVSDCDPNAKVAALKSSLDKMPAIEKSKVGTQSPSYARNVSRNACRTEQQLVPKTINRSHSLSQSPRRSFIRRSCDFYEDQISYLIQEALQERLAGKDGSMNSMDREAMDDWIRKRNSKK